jgi:hypothetical protein
LSTRESPGILLKKFIHYQRETLFIIASEGKLLMTKIYNKDKFPHIHTLPVIKNNLIEIDFDISMGMYDSHCYSNFFKNDKNRSH